MVTTEDIRRVRVFAGLEGIVCERLSRAAADISLSAGATMARYSRFSTDESRR
jgi:hypothetical protein